MQVGGLIQNVTNGINVYEEIIFGDVINVFSDA
jgi:hypothetical protein